MTVNARPDPTRYQPPSQAALEQDIRILERVLAIAIARMDTMPRIPR